MQSALIFAGYLQAKGELSNISTSNLMKYQIAIKCDLLPVSRGS